MSIINSLVPFQDLRSPRTNLGLGSDGRKNPGGIEPFTMYISYIKPKMKIIVMFC